MSLEKKILFCLAPAMTLPFFASLLYFVLLAGNPVAVAMYSLTKVFTLVWPLIAVLLVERVRPLCWKLQWKKHIASLPMGLLSGAIIAGGILLVYEFTSLGNTVRACSPAIAQKAREMDILDHYLPFAAFLCFFHSLLEEYYWRWYVFGRLYKVVGKKIAYFLAALSFAAHHFVIVGSFFPPQTMLIFGVCVGFGGAIWAWQYKRSGSLAGSWLSHMATDAAIMYIGYTLLFR